MNKFNLLLTAAAVVFSTPAMARNSDGGFVAVSYTHLRAHET